MLRNFEIQYIQGFMRIQAEIDKEQCPFHSHIQAIEILRKNNDNVSRLASIDPWQDTIEFRRRIHKDGSQFQIAANIGDPELIPLSDWVALP